MHKILKNSVNMLCILALSVSVITACGGGSSTKKKSTEKAISAFSFTDAANTALSADVTGTITEAAGTITASVPYGTTVTALVATFTVSEKAAVTVGTTEQVSGTTANDFTSPVVYTVTAEDGTTQNYTVTVSAGANTEKAITAFSFTAAANSGLSADVTGVINGTAITANVPIGTDFTTLKAAFTVSAQATVKVGATAQTSGTTANSFLATVTYTVTAGDGSTQDYTVTVSRDGMVSVPAGTSVSIGYTGVDEPAQTVASISAFTMAKFEVTYSLWYSVKTWATSNGYTFDNQGQEGHDGTPGAAPTANNSEPVTNISWYDAIKWCNALSQKEGLTPVYYTEDAHTTVYKTGQTDVSNTNALWTANGYKLPTNAQWEYAARYVNSTTQNRGDAPSGWTDSNTNSTIDNSEYDLVAWWSNNSTSTHDVGGKTANALGFYDMSGNVREMCWDWYLSPYSNIPDFTAADTKGPSTGTYRVTKYAAYSDTNIGTSFRNSHLPSSTQTTRGFRIAR